MLHYLISLTSHAGEWIMYVNFVPCSILVGAPNESGTNGTRTGAVYRCELGSGDNNNCSRVVPFDSYTGDANTACIRIYEQ